MPTIRAQTLTQIDFLARETAAEAPQTAGSRQQVSPGRKPRRKDGSRWWHPRRVPIFIYQFSEQIINNAASGAESAARPGLSGEASRTRAEIKLLMNGPRAEEAKD